MKLFLLLFRGLQAKYFALPAAILAFTKKAKNQYADNKLVNEYKNKIRAYRYSSSAWLPAGDIRKIQKNAGTLPPLLGAAVG